jgi:hypothetical protein
LESQITAKDFVKNIDSGDSVFWNNYKRQVEAVKERKLTINRNYMNFMSNSLNASFDYASWLR